MRNSENLPGAKPSDDGNVKMARLEKDEDVGGHPAKAEEVMGDRNARPSGGSLAFRGTQGMGNGGDVPARGVSGSGGGVTRGEGLIGSGEHETKGRGLIGSGRDGETPGKGLQGRE